MRQFLSNNTGLHTFSSYNIEAKIIIDQAIESYIFGEKLILQGLKASCDEFVQMHGFTWKAENA